jgi:hypothetical protein
MFHFVISYLIGFLVLALPCCQAEKPQSDGKQDKTANAKPSGPSGSNRLDRPRRWTIKMHYDDPKDFVKKLSELELTVGALTKDRTFLVYEKMPAMPPFHPKEMKETEFQAYAQQLQNIWQVSSAKITTRAFADSVGLKEAPRIVFLFIPKSLEQALIKYEIDLYQMPEAKIKEKKICSTFDVKRRGDQWEIEVIQSVINPDLSDSSFP